MYFPVGWPKKLAAQQDSGSYLIHLAANRDRILFVVLTNTTLSLWYCKPAVQIVCLRRPDSCLADHGTNCLADWKADSSMVAVTTSKGFILFFKVDIDSTGGSSVLFVQKEERQAEPPQTLGDDGRTGNKRDVVEIGCGENVPALKITQLGQTHISGSIKSVESLREELMVATGDGRILRVRWDGTINAEMTVQLSIIPFSVDLQHSRVSQLGDQGVWVSELQYCPLMGGFAAVLSNGKAAFITATTLKFEPNQVVGVWAQEIIQATCVAVNHKYTLMAYGCTSGEGIVFSLDEMTGAMQVSHKCVVSSKDFPDASSVVGAVQCLKWTPDGCALAMAWERGGFSLWSVFGALLLCSAGSQPSLYEDVSGDPMQHILAMAWGSEGYHLWLVSDTICHKASNRNDNSNKDTSNSDGDISSHQRRLLQLQFVKSSLTVNPCTTNHSHLFLQGEDKLYLNTEETVPAWSSGGQVSNGDLAMMSKQWQVVPIPHSYLAYNWPIRFAAVNSLGHCVAVAGKTGLAHYALFTRKWKLFGNETQVRHIDGFRTNEHDMVVTGGLTWWKDFICTACYNLVDQRDEIRFYPRDSKLDNTFANVVRIPSQIILLNTFHNILIVLCADSHVLIFRMTRHSDKSTPIVSVSKVQEVAIGNFIPHPATVVTITMTSLRTETASASAARGLQPPTQEAESIMLNVAGKLLMFQRDRSGPQVKTAKDSKERPLPFCAPVMVASNVENMWSCTHPNNRKPHMTEALWLGCGAAGMKVWLPLHPKEEGGKTRGFMSKRIMLPFQVDIYTLAILFEGGIILGATSDSVTYNSATAAEDGWPYMQLERTSHVYLHHILRQLLRRNLGVHALEMARSCTDLPYFAHVLELLLHEVLEEEATSKEPIPDPLLPRVAAFVQEFPEFLQTIVHCARKTEVALWQYLFTTVGSPKDLFEECLMSGQLDTAASYLIILQNMEKPIVSRQHATLLLDKALEVCNWDLARNLVRFLRAIDPDEADMINNSVRTRISSGPVYPSSYPNPPLSPPPKMERDADSAFVITAARSRSKSQAKEESPKEKVPRTRSDSNSKKGAKESTKDESTAEQFFIDILLSRHARKLLSSYRIRDLACFAANLEDYQLVSWLRKERCRAARVEDFVHAVKKLHEDFRWPLPIMTLQTYQRMTSSGHLTTSVSAPSLMDRGMNHDPTPVMTQKNNMQTTTPQTPDTSSGTPGSAEVFLQPQMSVEEGSTGATEQSDTSSALGELDGYDSVSWSDSLCLSELEQLSLELANKGAPQSEVELRYLLQIVLEAGCLEWAILVAVLLRDAMAVVRTVNTASLTDTPIEIVGRMREGMSFLELWADTECFGYKPFLTGIQGQIQQLAKIVEQNPPTSRLSIVSKRLSTSSAESNTDTEHTLEAVENDPDPAVDEKSNDTEKPIEEDQYDCTLS